MITQGTLETVGYREPGAEQRILAFLTHERARLIDIRYLPRSRWNPQWNKSPLQQRYGSSYRHIRALGNVNYNQPAKPIHLLNPEKHVQAAAYALHLGYSFLFLCACQDYERCHRKTVYDLVMTKLAEVQEMEREQEEWFHSLQELPCMDLVESRGIMSGSLPDGRMICTTVVNFVEGLRFMPSEYLDDPLNWLECVDGKEVWIEGEEKHG